jgi:hypothetical protein
MALQQRRNWLISSLEYAEFARICENNKWKLCPHLPRRGAQRGAELDKFMEKGLGPPDETPFSRAQVNAKFKHWKDSFRELGERRLIEEGSVESIEKILELFFTDADGRPQGILMHAPNVVLCNENTPLLSSFVALDQPCGDLLKSLRDSAIGSINDALVLTTGQSASYKAAQLENVKTFERAWADYVIEKVNAEFNGDSGSVATSKVDRSRVEAYGANVARAVLRFIHQAIMLGKDNSLSAKVTKICAAILDEISLIPDQKHRRETLYYITGWLLRVAEKQAARRKQGSCLQNALTELVKNASATDATEISSLPTRKVTEVQIHEAKLKCPSADFFNFVALVEHICETLLLEENLVIHGPGIVKDLAKILQTETAVLSRLKKCIGLPNIEAECLEETAGCLIRSYMNMRGKDYVRTILGASAKADTVGHRPKMQMVSMMGGQSKGKTSGHCFFCGSNEHYANVCVKRKIQPSPGQYQRSTNFVGESEPTIWYWCKECLKWQGHSTEEHEDREAVVEDVEANEERATPEQTLLEERATSEQTLLDDYHEMDAIVGSLDEDEMED